MKIKLLLIFIVFSASYSYSQTVVQLTKEDFIKNVHDYENYKEWNYLGDKPAIIDFYADWCGPCKRVAPIMEELADEYKDDIIIYKVDVDDEKELAGLFGIQSIPSILFIPMEEQPQMSIGAMKKEGYKNVIKEVLKIE